MNKEEGIRASIHYIETGVERKEKQGRCRGGRGQMLSLTTNLDLDFKRRLHMDHYRILERALHKNVKNMIK